LLSAQVTGAHLHLCFDGQEPPVQLHMLESAEGHDHASGFSRPHFDEEVSLNGDTSTRNDSLQFELPPATTGSVTFDLRPVVAAAAGLPTDCKLPSTARHELLPPPRGPPATA
jgi:hypothetical protein